MGYSFYAVLNTLPQIVLLLRLFPRLHRWLCTQVEQSRNPAPNGDRIN